MIIFKSKQKILIILIGGLGQEKNIKTSNIKFGIILFFLLKKLKKITKINLIMNIFKNFWNKEKI